MNSEQRFLDPEELLSNDGWLRALVRRLVSDEADVDDVVQATWARAYERPPDGRNDPRVLRSWLSRVAQNFARKGQRNEQRRTIRERQAAQPEHLPSTDSLVQRVEAQQHVAALVVELEEPYRSVILWRYFEGLTPKQIASQQEMPITTVKTRLQRALTQLRGKLEAKEGAEWRSTYALWILGWPAAETAAAATATTAATAGVSGAKTSIPGVLVMTKTKAKVLGAATILMSLGLGAWVVKESLGWATEDGQPADVKGAKTHAPPEEKANTNTTDQPTDWDAPRREQAARKGGAVTRAGSTTNTARVRGIVADPNGRPIAGAAVYLRTEKLSPSSLRTAGNAADKDAPEDEEAHGTKSEHVDAAAKQGTPRNDWELTLTNEPTPSKRISQLLGHADKDGVFDVSFAVVHGSLASGDRLFTLQEFALRPNDKGEIAETEDAIIVAARKVAMSGTVVDPDGQPMAGVEYQVEQRPLRALPWSLDRNVFDPERRRTGKNGRFRLFVPAAKEGRIKFEKTGYRIGYHDSAADAVDAQHLRVVLKRTPKERIFVFSGRVTDNRGRAVAGATIGMVDARTKSATDGSFRLQVKPYSLNQRLPLFAFKRGYQVVVKENLQEQAWRARDLKVAVDLVLAGPGRELRGRVLSAKGAPVKNVRVYIWNPTYFATGLDSLEQFVSTQRDSKFGIAVKTDASGRFAFDGLRDRPYVLRVQDEMSRWTVQTKPLLPKIEGGEDVVVRIPADAIRPKVTGKVLSPSGQPVAGAKVFVRFATAEFRRGNLGSTVRHGSGPTTVTDEQGRFVLHQVSRRHVRIRIEGRHLVPSEHELGESEPSKNVQLTVAHRCHFKVVVAAEDKMRLYIEARDAKGQKLTLYAFSPWGAVSGDRLSLHRHPTMAVSELVREIRLTRTTFSRKGRRDEGLGERRVELEPGKVTTIRF